MSDENTGNASSAEQTIPKARFDEVLADRRRLEEQVAMNQQMLSQVIAQQRQARAPEQESPELEELKQSNPAMYQRLKRQEKTAKELQAAHFTLSDKLDRSDFLRETGEAGKKALAEVEKILDHERRVNGNFRVDRQGIFTWLEGQKRLAKEKETPKAPTPEPVPMPEEGEIPSSNPRLATTVPAGTASVKQVEKSHEERFEELKDVVF